MLILFVVGSQLLNVSLLLFSNRIVDLIDHQVIMVNLNLVENKNIDRDCSRVWVILIGEISTDTQLVPTPYLSTRTHTCACTQSHPHPSHSSVAIILIVVRINNEHTCPTALFSFNYWLSIYILQRSS
jgi:hypothetical protein